MGNLHIWLFATQIVGLTVIAMFAVYVLLQFVDLRKHRSKQIEREDKILSMLQTMEKKLHEIEVTNKELDK